MQLRHNRLSERCRGDDVQVQSEPEPFKPLFEILLGLLVASHHPHHQLPDGRNPLSFEREQPLRIGNQ
jgi:hypothetical protein